MSAFYNMRSGALFVLGFVLVTPCSAQKRIKHGFAEYEIQVNLAFTTTGSALQQMPNSTGVQRLGIQQTIENNNRTVDSGAQDLGGDRGAQQLASNYFVQAGDSKKAVSYGDRAVTLAREQNAAPAEAADALRTRALAYAAGRDYAKAHDDAVEALKLDPDNETAQAIEKLTREKNIPEQIAVKIEPGAPPAPEIAAILEKERAASPVNRPEGFSTTVGEMKQADATAQLGDYEAMYAKATVAL